MRIASGSAERTTSAAPSPGELSTTITRASSPANTRAIATVLSISGALRKFTMMMSGLIPVGREDHVNASAILVMHLPRADHGTQGPALHVCTAFGAFSSFQ